MKEIERKYAVIGGHQGSHGRAWIQAGVGGAKMNIMDMHEGLLARIKENLPELEAMLEKVSGHWCYEDMIYRFYHQSFKVYWVQAQTLEIVDALEKISGVDNLQPWFMEIVKEGTGKKFDMGHNKEWTKHTRPMVEAFLHAKYFLEMAVKYGKMDNVDTVIPSGWASLAALFRIRA